MSTRQKQLIELAILLIVALGLLLIGTTTVPGIFILFLLPIPFVYNASRSTNRLLFLLLFLAASVLLVGPVGGFIGFFLGVMGSVMGNLYHNRRSALASVLGGAAVVFLSIVSVLAFITFGLGVDILAELEKTKQTILNGTLSLPSTTALQGDEWKNSIEQQFSLVQMILPTYFVVVSFLLSIIVHWLSRHILKLFKHSIPAMPPVREWKFPRALLVYYFLALLVMLLADQAMQGSYWASAVFNVKVILDIVFAIQGLSFCFFVFHLKRWRILAPILVVVSLFIFPVLTYILSLLGIFDLGVGLRKRVETRVKRG